MKPFSVTIMEDVIVRAEQIISKWETESSAYSKATYTYLFLEGRDDAPAFLSTVVDLKHSMNTLLSHGHSSSALLSRAHKLIESAMARLQKELRRILSSNLHPLLCPLSPSSSSSSSDSSEEALSSDVMAPNAATEDLRCIAECMLTCGYTKECVAAYTESRRSVVDDRLSRLGHVDMTLKQVRKLDWNAASRRISKWVAMSSAVVRVLFAGERSLCDYVFGPSSKSGVDEAVFAGVAKEPGERFLRFPEMVSTQRKSSPERIFHYLDLYDSISGLYPEIEYIFSYSRTATVRSQARDSLSKLGEFVRSSLDEFQSAIEKNDKNNGSVPGGGLHPITRYVMNYLSLLSDYTEALGDILHPLPERCTKLLSPASTVTSSPDEAGVVEPALRPVVSSRVEWLVVLLFGKLNGMAEMYKDAALSYLFLANNVRYSVRKVCNSNGLYRLLGEDWVQEKKEKARDFARSYERLGWRKVMEAIPETGREVGIREAEERMAEFNVSFEEAYRRQTSWVVTDKDMREELKLSIARKVMGPYNEFYERYLEVVGQEKGEVAARQDVPRLTPEDIGNYLSDLLYAPRAGSGSGSGSGSRSGSGSGSRSGSGSGSRSGSGSGSRSGSGSGSRSGSGSGSRSG